MSNNIREFWGEFKKNSIGTEKECDEEETGDQTEGSMDKNFQK